MDHWLLLLERLKFDFLQKANYLMCAYDWQLAIPTFLGSTAGASCFCQELTSCPKNQKNIWSRAYVRLVGMLPAGGEFVASRSSTRPVAWLQELCGRDEFDAPAQEMPLEPESKPG